MGEGRLKETPAVDHLRGQQLPLHPGHVPARRAQGAVHRVPRRLLLPLHGRGPAAPLWHGLLRPPGADQLHRMPRGLRLPRRGGDAHPVHGRRVLRAGPALGRRWAAGNGLCDTQVKELGNGFLVSGRISGSWILQHGKSFH